MKKADIYILVLAVLSIVAFYYTVTHMPESYVDAIKLST
jgi:hypothetical protein